MNNFMLSAPNGGFNLYGLLIGLGIVVAAAIAHLVNKRKALYYDDLVFDIVIAAVPLAVIGARVYFIIFDTVENGYMGFAEMFRVWNGGLAIYGAIIGAMIAIVILYYIRRNDPKKRVSVLQMFDFGAPFLILGQAIGRWGNFYNKEAYGQLIEGGSFFPIGVYIENGVDGTGWYQATFFYESMWNLLGFAVLLSLLTSRKRQSFDGFIFACYAAFYGIGRFFIEGIRSDSMWLIVDKVRISQVVSILFILAGLIVVFHHIYAARQANKNVYILTPLDSLDNSYFGVNPKLLRQLNDYDAYMKEYAENNAIRPTKSESVKTPQSAKSTIEDELTEEERAEIKREISRELGVTEPIKKQQKAQPKKTPTKFEDGFDD